MHEFQAWPKTARLFRDIVVTEKIDGTNAGIHISAVTELGAGAAAVLHPEAYSLMVDGTRYVVSAQSRKHLIWPGKQTDNYGFASWVYDNAAPLARTLGKGLHFGEWWGQGIRRGYGRDSRTFSLFNAERYADLLPRGQAMEGGYLDVVPTLYAGPFSESAIRDQLFTLQSVGSLAAPGWDTPEGICVYHSALGRVAKVTLDNHDAGKWEAQS